PNPYEYLSLSCLLLHQTPVTSHWIQTQHTETSICLRGTGGWRREMRSSHILIIQRDLMGGGRCCVERVCLDAATGRLSGVGGLIYQSHIKASAGEDGVMSACLDIMSSLEACPPKQQLLFLSQS